MLRRFFFIFLILGTTSLFNQLAEAQKQTLPLFTKLICIDPGHGGRDSGAIYGNVLEKNLNLLISKQLAFELNKVGASTYLIRDGDYDYGNKEAARIKRSDLNQRIKMIEQSGCDIYLAIHLNASMDASWRGAQAFYEPIHLCNRVLAETIQNYFIKDLDSKRTVNKIRNLYMYQHIETPGVLLELGFMTNTDDLFLLQNKEHQLKLIQSIRKGVIDYFNMGGNQDQCYN